MTPDIDFHWDKDEDLTDSGGPPLHPHLSTVTYLGDVGAPTLIIERAPGCPYAAVACGESDPETSDPRGAVACTYVSQPRTGKHLVFDGRWLHGAPAALAAEPLTTTRITFLANVWLHYTPMGLQRLPRVEVKRRNFGTQRIPFECRAVLPVIEHQVDEKAANHQFAFGPNGDDFALHLSMPNLSSAIVPQEASLPRDSGHHLLQFARGAAKVTAAGDDDDEANAPTQAAAKRRKK